MKTKGVKPSPQQMAFRDAMIATMRTHAATLPADELLAVAAHMVGQILAMQDQRKMTPAMGLALISSNIEVGNAEVIAGLANAQGEKQ